jgi:hypothetical protein
MMKKIDFKIASYFSENFFFLGILLAPVGIALLFVKPLVGIVFGLISFVILTTEYRLRIDTEKQIYLEYLRILGFRSGTWQKFYRIEYFFIKKNKVRLDMHLRAASTSIRKDVFDAYLKFSEEDKIHVASMDSHDKLLKRIKPMADLLKTDIVDFTKPDPD